MLRDAVEESGVEVDPDVMWTSEYQRAVGAGAQITVGPAAVDRAMCDAQHIGSIDGTEPERAYQDIPPSVARFVWRRDGGRCRVPGCRSSRGLELHHLIHRADGGSHEASNIALICSACHQSHHAGILTISGTADRIEVHRPEQADSASSSVCAGAHVNAPNVTSSLPETGAHIGAVDVTTPVASTRAHIGAVDVTTPVASTRAHMGASAASKLDAAILRTQAKAALTGLGWKPAVAHVAVAAAAAAAGTEVTLERLIFESLRRCPAPKA